MQRPGGNNNNEEGAGDPDFNLARRIRGNRDR